MIHDTIEYMIWEHRKTIHNMFYELATMVVHQIYIYIYIFVGMISTPKVI